MRKLNTVTTSALIGLILAACSDRSAEMARQLPGTYTYMLTSSTEEDDNNYAWSWSNEGMVTYNTDHSLIDKSLQRETTFYNDINFNPVTTTFTITCTGTWKIEGEKLHETYSSVDVQYSGIDAPYHNIDFKRDYADRFRRAHEIRSNILSDRQYETSIESLDSKILVLIDDDGERMQYIRK